MAKENLKAEISGYGFGEQPTAVIFMILDKEGEGVFGETVRILEEWVSLNLSPGKSMKITSTIRTDLEKIFDDRYIGKTHLAVAMARLGYRIVFRSKDHFDANYKGWERRKSREVWDQYMMKLSKK